MSRADPETLRGLEPLVGAELMAASRSCLEDLHAMSGALTTQVLTLLPIQAGLIAGYGLALTRASGLPPWLAVGGIVALTGAVSSSVYALARVHDRTLWEHGADCDRRSFVLGEARRLRAKGLWTRASVAATLVSALAVALCHFLAPPT